MTEPMEPKTTSPGDKAATVFACLMTLLLVAVIAYEVGEVNGKRQEFKRMQYPNHSVAEYPSYELWGECDFDGPAKVNDFYIAAEHKKCHSVGPTFQRGLGILGIVRQEISGGTYVVTIDPIATRGGTHD